MRGGTSSAIRAAVRQQRRGPTSPGYDWRERDQPEKLEEAGEKLRLAEDLRRRAERLQLQIAQQPASQSDAQIQALHEIGAELQEAQQAISTVAPLVGSSNQRRRRPPPEQQLRPTLSASGGSSASVESGSSISKRRPKLKADNDSPSKRQLALQDHDDVELANGWQQLQDLGELRRRAEELMQTGSDIPVDVRLAELHEAETELEEAGRMRENFADSLMLGDLGAVVGLASASSAVDLKMMQRAEADRQRVRTSEALRRKAQRLHREAESQDVLERGPTLERAAQLLREAEELLSFRTGRAGEVEQFKFHETAGLAERLSKATLVEEGPPGGPPLPMSDRRDVRLQCAEEYLQESESLRRRSDQIQLAATNAGIDQRLELLFEAEVFMEEAVEFRSTAQEILAEDKRSRQALEGCGADPRKLLALNDRSAPQAIEWRFD